jgi:hypothetical protein
MLTTFIAAVAFATVTTVILMYFLTQAIHDREARLVFFLMGAFSPVMLVVSGLRALLRYKTDLQPCPELLANVESEIEQERISRFGGKRIIPSLAERWQAAYLESLRRTATRVSSCLPFQKNRAASAHV